LILVHSKIEVVDLDLPPLPPDFKADRYLTGADIYVIRWIHREHIAASVCRRARGRALGIWWWRRSKSRLDIKASSKGKPTRSGLSACLTAVMPTIIGRKHGPSSLGGTDPNQNFEWLDGYLHLSEKVQWDLSTEAHTVNARSEVSSDCSGRWLVRRGIAKPWEASGRILVVL
jgi:hypothetical protein